MSLSVSSALRLTVTQRLLLLHSADVSQLLHLRHTCDTATSSNNSNLSETQRWLEKSRRQGVSSSAAAKSAVSPSVSSVASVSQVVVSATQQLQREVCVAQRLLTVLLLQ